MSAQDAPAPELVVDGAGSGEPLPVDASNLQPGSMPLFDYEGALELARKFEEVADAIDTAHKVRSKDRDAAAQAWEGDMGDDFVDRNADEDTSAKNVAAALRENARSWAEVWAATVNEANRVQRAYAWQEKKRLEALADEGFGWHDVADVADSIRGKSSGLDERDLPMPPHVDAPGGPAYVSPATPFVRFRVTVDDVWFTPTSAPPALSCSV